MSIDTRRGEAVGDDWREKQVIDPQAGVPPESVPEVVPERVTIGGALIDDRTQFGKKGNILGLAIRASMP